MATNASFTRVESRSGPAGRRAAASRAAREISSAFRRVTGQAGRDRQSLERVLAAYCHLVDSKQTTGWDACFCEDAVLSIEPTAGVDRRGVELRGLSEIEAAFARTAARSPQQLHQVSLRSVAFDGAIADTNAAFVRLDSTPGGPVPVSFGRYADKWRRTRAGWRIESRLIHLDSSTPDRPRVPAPETHLEAALRIRDVVFQYCRAIDRRDYESVRRCYHPDATDHHGTYHGGVDGFIQRIQVELPKCERTFHFVGNVLVDQQTATTARCESYVLAYHRLAQTDRAGLRDRVVALRYVDRFELRDDGWKIARRWCVCEWTRTDPVPEGWDFGPDHLRGVAGPDDPLYAPEFSG